jgi:aerobic-type carbon monoxide dehydrogenase small subunit (CoxS/CutS family)
MLIEFQLNGKPASVDTDPTRPLLWVLRTDFGLTGTKCGCAKGQCGACTVLMSGMAVRSCMVSIGAISQTAVTTIEGVVTGNQLHPVQQAFMQESAMQCGFCTPGMILSALGYLQHQTNPTEADVIRVMNHNLCRCGSHTRIVKAILAAAKAMGGGP